jgi:hypothetical protein
MSSFSWDDSNFMHEPAPNASAMVKTPTFILITSRNIKIYPTLGNDK